MFLATVTLVAQDSVLIKVQDVRVSYSPDSVMRDKVSFSITNQLDSPIYISEETTTYFESHKFPSEISIEILGNSSVRGVYYDEISICGFLLYDTILPGQTKTKAIPIVLRGLKSNMQQKAKLHLTVGSWEDRKHWKTYESNIFNIYSKK